MPAVFSHQCQGQFLQQCLGMSIPVFPTRERRVFLLAEAVSCFHSQLPTVTLPFQDPTSWLKAATPAQLGQDTILAGSVWDFALLLYRGPGCDGSELL